MTKASDNAFPSILITEGTEPSAPAAGKQRMYIDSTTHVLMLTNSSGTETAVGSGTGNVATDAIWDAAGDLVQGTGANTAAKLTLGAAGTVVRSTGSTNAYAYPPGYEFDYVAFTGSASPAGTTVGTATTIVTGSSVSYDGSTVILVEFFAPQCRTGSGSGNELLIELMDGATDLGIIGIMKTPAGAVMGSSLYCAMRLTPSNASHQYIIKAWVNAGTALVAGGAGGTATVVAGFIRITKV